MVLTPEILARAIGCPEARAAEWLPHIQETGERFDLMTPARMAAFVAQTAHESARFVRLEENLNYGAAGLLATWPKRFTPEDAQRCARHPELIANKVYASRMGNGDDASGDGWLFRGRGLIQVTGRANYAACGAALGLMLTVNPDLLATPQYAALSAGWFWDSRGLNDLADSGHFVNLTMKINGGLNGIGERTELWDRAKEALSHA